MNRLLLSTSLALALSSSLVLAQQQDAAPAPVVKNHHRAHDPQRETAKLSKRLNLSSDQTAKVEPILASRDQKIATLTSDITISPMIMKQQMRAIHKETKQQLAAVLTPEQLQLMKSQHHNHGNPTQTPQTNPQSAL